MRTTGKVLFSRLPRRLCALLAGLSLASAARAQSMTAGAPGDLFSFGASARALSLGGAYTAMAQDVTSLYYNPAGLGSLPSPELSLMHSQLFGDATFDYLGYAHTMQGQSAWGVEVLHEGITGVPGRDAFNNPTGSFSYEQYGFGLGAGWRNVLLPGLSLGLGIKAEQRSLDGSDDKLFGADLGAQYGPFLDRRVSLGLVLQNVGGFASGDTSDRLPLIEKFGAVCRVIDGLSLVGEISGDGSVAGGAEYVYDVFALRAGYASSGFTMGGGITFMRGLQLDLAVLQNSALGTSERVSLGYRFGAGKPAKQEIVSQDFLREAQAALADRRYAPAADLLSKALDLGPKLEDAWGERSRRLNDLVRTLHLRIRPDAQAGLAAAGEQGEEGLAAIRAYLDGQSAKAMLLAHAALGADRRQSIFEELLRGLAALTGLPVRNEDILSAKALAGDKLKRAQADFNDRRFDQALHECEDVLTLEPAEELGWVRLGSVYYALGDAAKARGAYEKALALDPNDAVVLEFMRAQGWK